MTVPNLDAMDRDALMEFWMKYQNIGKRKDCAELVGGRFPNYTIYAGSLGAYAANKATAIDCRKRGDIQTALAYEKICQLIYKKLPWYCRW